MASGKNITTTENILLSGTTGAFGYAAGAGASFTMSGSTKTQNITMHKPTGTIITGNSEVPAFQAVSFTLFNDTISPTDFVIVQHISGGSLGRYNINAAPNASAPRGAIIQIRNLGGFPESEILTLRFVVIKSVDT